MGRGRDVEKEGRGMGREERVGKGRKGRDGGEKGKVTEGMGGTGEVGWDGKGRERETRKRREREERGHSPSNFNAWRRHCREPLPISNPVDVCGASIFMLGLGPHQHSQRIESTEKWKH